MTFNTNDDRLTAYALGELDEASRTEFESELSNSPELQHELSELQSLAGMLRSELAMEAKPSLTSEQHLALLAQAVRSTPVVIAPSVATPRSKHRWEILVPGIALGLVIAVGAATYSYQKHPLELNEQILAENESQSFGNRPKSSNAWYVSASDPYTSVDDVMQLDGDYASTSMSGKPRHVVPGMASPNDPKGLVTDLMVDAVTLPQDFSPKAGGNGQLEAKLDVIKTQDERAVLATSSAPGTNSVRLSIAPAAEGEVRQKGLDRFYKERTPTLVTGTASTNWADHSDQLGRLHDLPELKTYEYRAQEARLYSEAYEALVENAFLTPIQQPLSTFSIDVDSASYSNVRRFLTAGQRPPADAVRLEEMVNYFNYSYPQPKDGEPFSVTADAAACPWQSKNYLARIGLQARTIEKAKRPPTNLVFLLDVSGSMQAANKLPLVKQAMTMLTEELNDRDRIAIVTYAGDAGVKLASTHGSDQTRIMQSIEALQAGGSTNGAAGINLAYEEAVRHFNGEGENRVILCTDGDFNVGVSSDDELVQLIQQQAKSKVFLSIFGFGMGNLKDAKLEKLADKGNGHYGYIDDLKEARRVFNEELVGTLYTVAKDVKIQVEFNPLTVGAYRLIGYENRMLAAKDFNDDTKDAGEIGAGHTVTALYEIVPKNQWAMAQPIDPLKYSGTAKEPVPVVETAPKANLPPEAADDLFTVKLRYKQPTADTSVKTIDYVVDDIATRKIVPSADFVWAASVASFGMQLRNSQFKGNWTLNDVYEAAQGAKGPDANGRRREFLDLVQAAKRLTPDTKKQ